MPSWKTNSKKNKRAGRIARMVLRRDFGSEPDHLRVGLGIDREMRPAISLSFSMNGEPVRVGKLIHNGNGNWTFDTLKDVDRPAHFTVTSDTHKNKTGGHTN